MNKSQWTLFTVGFAILGIYFLAMSNIAGGECAVAATFVPACVREQTFAPIGMAFLGVFFLCMLAMGMEKCCCTSESKTVKPRRK